jgi:diketogulonate reductase-like aldo/keto reductase
MFTSKYTKLNNGVEIPVLGLGVWQVSEGTTVKAVVQNSLEVGYRLIDSAQYYGNEAGVGEAVRRSSLLREEIFVTTKLANPNHGYQKAIESFYTSLDKLNLEYIDLFLIHYPVTGLRKESWQALEEIYQSGKCRAIGVSNYTVKHLIELLEDSSVIPTVNQVEFHPFLFQKELLDFCNQNQILLQAYSPLTSGQRINDPNISKIASKYNKSNAQILIRWCLEHDVITIPKTTSKARLEENFDVFDFEISPEDMDFLDSLNENLRTCWDPSDTL